MAKDVIVVVQRDALPTERESLDILLVSTTGEQPVATYRDLDSVKAVFGDDGPTPNAKIVRKAATLLNQGKTTLAETLVDKFKIVGFAPPSASPSQPAVLTIDFPKTALEQKITSGTTIYVRIGGDDNAVITFPAIADLVDAPDIAAVLDGATFTKGGKTYIGAFDMNSKVTFTATEDGEADTIPEMVDVYTDAKLSEQVTGFTPSVEFINGEDAVSAPDNLVNAIEAFNADVDNDWYYFLTDRDEPEYVKALACYAESTEPTEAELGAGAEDHRKFYMGQTCDKTFECTAARAAVIYADEEYLNEEPDASYTGNVGPFYPKNVTWKFKRPQDGNAVTSEGAKLITLPKLTEGERDALDEQHVNYLTEEYKRQYVKQGVCLNGEFIDVVLGGDWIAKRMRDLLYDILMNNANIDYSDAGFQLVSTAVFQTLLEASDADHNIVALDAETKAPVITINVPKYADSTETQRNNRQMPDITWEALLAGAVHGVKTKGVLKASL